MATVRLVSFRQVPTKVKNKQIQLWQRGFTLLELLIVLAMMGLLGALALPALGKLIDSIRYRNERSSIIAQINSLGYRDYLLAQDYEFSTGNVAQVLKDGKPALNVPEGWTLKLPKPIHYQFNGYCSGGTVIVTAPDGKADTLELQAPSCGVKIE